MFKNMLTRLKQSVSHKKDLRTYVKDWFKSPYTKTFLVIFIAGALLKFYKIEPFMTFLGDQARDAIIMKRIVTLEDIPGVGAPSSVGSVFLGPFYYYIMAPWILFSNFNPIGPAIGVAVYSLIGIFGIFILLQRQFSLNEDFSTVDSKKIRFASKIALIVSIFLLFSYHIFSMSRYSWNPNLLPYMTLFAVYFFIRGLQTKHSMDYILSGLAVSFCIQFHYVSLSLGIPLVLLALPKMKSQFKQLMAFTGAFLVGYAPMIIFDIKHNFVNSKGFLTFFSDDKAVTTSRGLAEIGYTMQQLVYHAFGIEPTFQIAVIFIGILVIILLRDIRFKNMITYYIAFFLPMLVVTSYFTFNKHPHYFNALYPLLFVIVAYYLAKTTENKNITTILFTRVMYIAVMALLIIFVYLQVNNMDFLRRDAGSQITRAANVARVIQEHVTDHPYQTAAIPNKFGDGPYRYFLELWGDRPLSRDTRDNAKELFVICDDPCKPIGDPLWDIAYFAPTRIDGTWDVEDVTIYKLGK